MAFARVNGVVLHYEERGNPQGPAIAFANSLGTDFRIWDEVCALLSADWRIILHDKRGHGLSEATAAPYRIEDHSRDLEALLDHLGIARVALVGLSVGGLIVQDLAARRPELVTAMVLCCTAHKIGTADMWNQRIATATGEGIGAMADGIMERWFTPAFRRPDNPDFAGYTAMLTRTPAQGYAGTCAALRDADLTQSTSALALPALCIAGDRDGSTPPDLVRSTADLIAGCRFEIIEDAGHLPCIEKPAETARLIGEFLAGVPR